MVCMMMFHGFAVVSTYIFHLLIYFILIINVAFYFFQSKEIGDNDLFYFNTEFSHKLKRIKINQIQMKETVRQLPALPVFDH